ncbi:MAG: RagB/SusD family nutrient uptake outer membrane protein [Longimicrobiales bacterium]
MLALPALAGCDSLLGVEYPHVITDDDLDESSAAMQVYSAVALFECGYTAFGLFALGHEDTMSSVSGVGSGNNVFAPSAVAGLCDASDTSVAWFDQVMGTRVMLSNPTGTGAYDRLQAEWDLGDRGEHLSAIAAIYMAASLTHLGEFMCDISLDGSDLIPYDDVLAMAESWITDRAFTHLASTGDFALPNGISSSALLMATALRARIRWARGDLAGAAADAQVVPQGFSAWITREAGGERRNRIWFTNTFQGYSAMMRLNRTWNGPTRRPNPATGQTWPAIIPFTGWISLGITPDGRTLETNNVPVRFAEEARNVVHVQVPCSASSPQPGCAIGAVQDRRVLHARKQTGLNPEVAFRYGTTSAGSDSVNIPYMTWEELTLIRAEHANQMGDQAGAVALINAIRASPSPIPPATTMAPLPAIAGSYLTELSNGVVDNGLTDHDAVRYAILEERRREFFSEAGRYWSTKLKNLDVLWFPRGEGAGLTYLYQGGVRLAMPDREYERNPFLLARGGLAARGTGCDPVEAPDFP